MTTNISGWKITPEDVVEGYTILLGGGTKAVVNGDVISAEFFDRLKVLQVVEINNVNTVARVEYTHKNGSAQTTATSLATFDFQKDTIQL